jgi:perosamine synthetase
VLAVHTYGYPVSGDRLREFADAHRLLLIEDAAEALGARTPLAGKLVACGALGDVSIFSLYANKSITSGEGGLVVCRSAEHAARIRDLRNLGFSRDRRRFWHDVLGTNARLSGIGAALAVSQLARLEQVVQKKNAVARAYAERLAADDRIELPRPEAGTEPVPWMVALTLSDRVRPDAAEVLSRLSERGIDARPFFMGMHRQPALIARGLGSEQALVVCDRLSERGLYLPSSPLLDEATIDRVCGALNQALEP